MRSSAPHAIALTLFMLLLVLLSAFFFLFRVRVAPLENQLEEAESMQAEIELELSSVNATKTAVTDALATAESEKALLDGQLFDVDREREALKTQLEMVTAQLESANSVADQYQAQGPLISIVTPQEGAIVTENDLVNITATASDVIGVQTVNILIGEENFELSGEGQQTTIVRQSWDPPAAGEFTLTITAVNLNNTASLPITRTITVNPVPTAVPPTSPPPPDSG